MAGLRDAARHNRTGPAAGIPSAFTTLPRLRAGRYADRWGRARIAVGNTSPILPDRGTVMATANRRVLIVDDHPIVRQGLRRLIEQEDDLSVCGEVETAREAKSAIRELKPDAAIVDISLRQGDGIELIKDTRAHYP